jgi:curved DNA-binding protein CbpA
MLLLGVDPPLTIEDLKQAFRKKARSTHPDKGGCGDEFIEVKEAYDFLLTLC